MTVVRCETCGQVVQPPLPTCSCGHPMLNHHMTERGNVTSCTVWSPNQCPCQKGIPRKEEP